MRNPGRPGEGGEQRRSREGAWPAVEGRGVGKIGGAAGPGSRSRAGLKLVGVSASRWGGAGRGRGDTSGRWRCVCCGKRSAERRRCPGCEFRSPVPATRRRRRQSAVLSLHGPSSPQPLCLPRLTSAKVAVAAASQRAGFARTRSVGTSVAGLAGLSDAPSFLGRL